MRIKDILDILVDAVFPRICPVCNKIVSPAGSDICPDCARKLTFTEPPVCTRCGKPVDDKELLCRDCMKGKHVYDEGCAALIYDEYMSKSIYRFKYNGKREFAHFYGRVMYECLADKIGTWGVDAIVPVPIHRKRLAKRGYNQAALIAKELGKRLRIPVNERIIVRSGATGAQKRLSARERQNNLKKAFKVTQNVVKLDSVLIVDDIYTTGATVDAMARVLKNAGVKRVYFATLCIGRGS